MAYYSKAYIGIRFSYSHSLVTVALSCTISEIKRDMFSRFDSIEYWRATDGRTPCDSIVRAVRRTMKRTFLTLSYCPSNSCRGLIPWWSSARYILYSKNRFFTPCRQQPVKYWFQWCACTVCPQKKSNYF